jgi:serine/threonine-protein kinase
VRAAEAEGKLIRLATGDGMALVFRNSPEAPAQCALELSRADQEHPELRLRMGIHSGPINEVSDVNERANVTGAGINMAQRVMDCGDAGHILLSKRAADDLAQYRHWQPLLHELGECEVKHGVRLAVVNLYTAELGNPAVPEKFRQEGGHATAVATAAPRRKTLFVGGLLLVALALALPLAVWFGRREAVRTGPIVPNDQHPVALAEKRIAILPFKPLVAQDRDQVLEIGMADSLITKLSNSREIIVTSLTTVRKYGGLEQDPIAAGRALGVDSILEGNVQRAGDQIRVTARLINVADGRSLWAGTFDEKFTDVFSVQNTISQKVADALALRLSGEEKERLTKPDTGDVGAYQLYLTGRYHWNKLIPPEIRQSIGYYQQAIDLDPKYALAYFGLAEAYRSLAITSDVPPKEVCPQAVAAAEKALELEPSLAEAHASLVFSYVWYDWRWSDAEEEAKRAVELNPNSAFAHLAYGHLLSDLGRHEEAIRQSRRAIDLDPVSLIGNTQHGAFLYHARRNDEAIVQLQKTLELDHTFWIAHLFLGKALMDRRQYPEAIAEFAKARDFSGGNSEAISMSAYVWTRAGDAAKARALLDQFLAVSARRYVPPYNIAVVYLGLGDLDACFARLDKAYADHDVRLSFLRVDPKWDPVRSDPRFVSVLKRIGLE